MAQRIVDALEAIQINKHHAKVATAALRAQHRVFQLLLKELAIGQARQRVIHGQIMHLFFGVLAFGNILHSAVQAHHATVASGARRRLCVYHAI